jgi:hypothetical protein
MMENDMPDAVDRVGQFEMRVQVAEPTPQSSEQWEQRVDVLVTFLLDLWRKEAA